MLVRIFPLLELGPVLSKDEVEAYDSKQEYLQIQRMEVTLSVLLQHLHQYTNQFHTLLGKAF